MRLPSIDRAIAGARHAVARFPMVILSGVATAVAMWFVIDTTDTALWLRLAAATSLGLPLFTALTYLARRRGLGEAATWAVRLVGVFVLAAFWWRWDGWSDEVAGLRFFHLAAALHFLVAFVAYLGVREHNGFWQFNRLLFIRFLTGVVYSVVLYAGLAIALLGVDNLLGIDVADEAYFRLWAFIALVFQTWFFTAGLPDDFEALEGLSDYPGGLRAFAQYVLLPLVGVYLLILTAYLGRVLITRVWPSGWIGYLVSALAALGILSLLLVHPLREREGYGWIDKYARVFWIAILPPVAMLLMAIWQRIDQYGITERRFLLATLAVWLAAVAAYYAVTRSRNIKIIPGSLAAVAVLTFLGPLSAYAVSLRSQVGRLEGLLERHGALADGRISQVADDVPAEDRREMTGTLRYIIQHHGTSAIDPWFPEGVAMVDTLGAGTGPSNFGEAQTRTALILRYVGVEPVTGRGGPIEDFRSYFAEYPRPPLDVAGFDHALTSVTLDGLVLEVDGVRYSLAFAGGDLVARLSREDQEIATAPIGPLLGRLGRAQERSGGTAVSGDSLRLDAEGAGHAVRIYVTQLTVDARGDSTIVTGAMGDVLLRLPGGEGGASDDADDR